MGGQEEEAREEEDHVSQRHDKKTDPEEDQRQPEPIPEGLPVCQLGLRRDQATKLRGRLNQL